MKSHVQKYDAIIIGTGFGGAMTAYRLSKSGLKVLMLERGKDIKRMPENWNGEQALGFTNHYNFDWPFHVVAGGNNPIMGSNIAVGGQSVFYGGVSFRLREKDFDPPQEIITDSNAKWPIDYNDLEPYYSEAEELLNVSGDSDNDPTQPFRSKKFPQSVGILSDISKKVENSAKKLDLNPFHLPLAINYHGHSRNLCEYCTTCDSFACAVGAKNDLATMIIPKILSSGGKILTQHMVTKLNLNQDKIESVSVKDIKNDELFEFKADCIILSAGALSSPQILLSSDLAHMNPGNDIIGRYLMRHVNNIVFGIFPGKADKQNRFHKQLGIMDFYFGHKNYPHKKIGSLQQLQTPHPFYVQDAIKGRIGKLVSKAVSLITGLLTIAEDQPNYNNRIWIDKTNSGSDSMHKTSIIHNYSKRDEEVSKILSKEAIKILKGCGAIGHYTHNIKTFSHAVGTLRMGDSEKHSVLDSNCNFRGIKNLYVLDGSFMPTSGAVNPSLTISANALRVSDYILNKS